MNFKLFCYLITTLSSFFILGMYTSAAILGINTEFYKWLLISLCGIVFLGSFLKDYRKENK